MNQLVSIIIPSYNHSQFIAEAIESVLNQTYKNNELIIIDDGSRDDSLSVIEKYRKSGSVKIVSQANRGAHNTINRGIELSGGKYISILNSDDVYHEKRIERCMDAIEHHGCDMVFTDLRYVDSESRPVVGEKADFYSNLKATSMAMAPENVFWQNNVAVTTSNFFILKKAINKIGTFRNLRYCHDWDWMLRCVTNGTYTWLHEELLSYRDHESNTIKEGNTWAHMIENSFVLSSFMVRYAKKNNASIENLSTKIFQILANNTSFFPLAVLLFTLILSGGCTEDELLQRINTDGFIDQFTRVATSGDVDIRALMPPDFIKNYFRQEEPKNIIGRIIRKALRILKI